jgi:acyl-CoA thioester hydrolase
MRAQHVEYHAPARFDDEVEVFVRVKELGRTSVTWAFDAYRADTGEHLASANQVAVLIDTAARRPVDVPEVFRHEVARFEEQEVEA